MRIKAVIKLVCRIITHGKLRHNTFDDTSRRRQALRSLQAVLPASLTPSSKKSLIKSRYLKWWLGQAAFVKNTLRSGAGHLVYPAEHLAYVRVPKAASTAISFLLLKANIPAISQMNLAPETINFLADVYLQKKLAPEDSGRAFFTVVRNPFSRVVSFYRSFFEHGEKHFIYEDYLFGIFRKGMSFKEFVGLVELVPDKLKDQHVKPQYAFLKFYQRRGIAVRTFKLEDREPLNTFLLKHGLRLDIINKSSKAYDYRHYYDEEALEIVNRIYQKDISLLGYGREYEGLRRFLSRNGSHQSAS